MGKYENSPLGAHWALGQLEKSWPDTAWRIDRLFAGLVYDEPERGYLSKIVGRGIPAADEWRAALAALRWAYGPWGDGRTATADAVARLVARFGAREGTVVFPDDSKLEHLVDWGYCPPEPMPE